MEPQQQEKDAHAEQLKSRKKDKEKQQESDGNGKEKEQEKTDEVAEQQATTTEEQTLYTGTQDIAQDSQSSPLTGTSGTPWLRYFEQVKEQYIGIVAEMAARQSYDIPLRKLTGKQVRNPFTGQMEPELSGEYHTKKFTRHRISHRDWQNLEILRAQLESERRPKEAIELMAKIYEYCAFIYLNMQIEELHRTDWELMKPILDGCKMSTDMSGGRQLPKLPGAAMSVQDRNRRPYH
jgi:hypothetical protein